MWFFIYAQLSFGSSAVGKEFKRPAVVGVVVVAAMPSLEDSCDGLHHVASGALLAQARHRGGAIGPLQRRLELGQADFAILIDIVVLEDAVHLCCSKR